MKAGNTSDGIVLLFARPLHRAQLEKISGVYAAAIKRGWQVQPIEAMATPERTRMEIALWHPIGCIVDKLAMPEQTRLGRSAFCGVPTVIMGSDSRRRKQIFDRSVQDGDSVVAVAAAELTSAKPASFAFVCEPGNPSWSRERESAFAVAVAGRGDFSKYGGPAPYSAAGRIRLTRWLRTLKRPCGILLAADHLAMPFYAAVKDAGFLIPDDFAVVGVDNDEQTCLNANPPLSSVQLNYFRAGENAVALLASRLANPETAPQTEIYRATGVVRRLSSQRPSHNRRVSAALSFITMHAADDLSVAGVVSHMGCCRRLAERMFRENCKKSILDAIHEVRMEKAFMLLRKDSFPIDAIPSACGYSSTAFFKVLFKRITGFSMREWRRRQIMEGR